MGGQRDTRRKVQGARITAPEGDHFSSIYAEGGVMQYTSTVPMEDAWSQVRSGQRYNRQILSDHITLFRIDISCSFLLMQRDGRISPEAVVKGGHT